MRNLKQTTKQLSKLTIMLALILVPTIANAQTFCSQISTEERIQPIQILTSKTCEDKLKYPTSAIYDMVQQCFNHLNMNSIQMFGAPIIPIFGINQCVCITNKIRLNYECMEDYMINVTDGTAGEVLGEFSKQCIIEGAMGEAARKAYLGATDNATKKDTYPPAIKDEPKKEKTSNKKPVTWDDLINK